MNVRKSKVDRAMIFIDRQIELASVQGDIAQLDVPEAGPRIARAQPHRELQVGFRLFDATQGIFRYPSRRVQCCEVWIDREPCISDTQRVAPMLGQNKVAGLW